MIAVEDKPGLAVRRKILDPLVACNERMAGPGRWERFATARVRTQAGDLTDQNRNTSLQMAKTHSFAVTGPSCDRSSCCP